MCTVSFVPDPEGPGYLLASNRDEALSRPRAHLPRVTRRGGVPVAAPIDPEGGGTWIGVNALGLTVCLLNGDRPAATTLPATPESRGRIADALLDCGSADEALARLADREAEGTIRTRPFVLLVAEPGHRGHGARLVRFAWDGARGVRAESFEPRVATSSTAFPDGAARARGRAFASLVDGLRGRDAQERRQAVLDWHASHLQEEPGGGPLSVCMHRADARTVSRTLVGAAEGLTRLTYHDGWPCRPGPESTVCLGC